MHDLDWADSEAARAGGSGILGSMTRGEPGKQTYIDIDISFFSLQLYLNIINNTSEIKLVK